VAQFTLTICREPDQGYPVLQELLGEFQQQQPSYPKVEVRPISWGEYRNEVVGVAIHNKAGDISQIGAPLVSDLLAMNALRPFSPAEMHQMGGAAAFASAAWESAQRELDGKVYSLPWLADPRVIFYWRDMLNQAGVDAETAFQTEENLIEALSRLQTSGIEKPWLLTAGHKHSAIHSVSSWIWAAGGDFVSKDGKKALFMEPKGLAGLKAYFSMIRFMSRESHTADYSINSRLFASRKSAIIQGNLETATYIINNTPAADVHSNLGIALPFGVPYVGGSSLVIWSKSRLNEQAAVSLAQFLTGKTTQSAYPASIGLLPVRLDVLSEPPYSTDPILQGFSEAIRRGRVFPITKLSGLLEEHMGNTLVEIWKTLASDPNADLDTLITTNLAPVARRYNNWFE
jgi:multiple sugar transport system substrate-binding protein